MARFIPKGFTWNKGHVIVAGGYKASCWCTRLCRSVSALISVTF